MAKEEILYDCIVIGGGISGVSFAHYLHTIGQKVLVVESENNIGGQIQSLFSEKYSGYWREFGAHTCYNSYTYLLSVLKDIERSDLLQPLGKGSYMTFSDGRVKKMFADMSVPSLVLNGVKLFILSQKGKTVKEYFGKIVGKRNYEKLFSKLFRAVISQNADDYPAEMFLKRRKDRYKEYPRKYTFRGGISRFLDAIIEKDKLEVEKNCAISGIRMIDGRYEVAGSGGRVFRASKIAIATDPKTASEIVRNIEPSLSDVLASIPLFRSESMNVIVPKEKITLPAVAGIISVDDSFHSAVSRDLVEDDTLRSFTFHFEEGISDEDEKMKIICKVLGINRNDVLELATIRHILPSLRLSHRNMAQQVDETGKSDNVYILGNYFYGLSIEDCIHRSADEFDRFRNLL